MTTNDSVRTARSPRGSTRRPEHRVPDHLDEVLRADRGDATAAVVVEPRKVAPRGYDARTSAAGSRLPRRGSSSSRSSACSSLRSSGRAHPDRRPSRPAAPVGRSSRRTAASSSPTVDRSTAMPPTGTRSPGRLAPSTRQRPICASRRMASASPASSRRRNVGSRSGSSPADERRPRWSRSRPDLGWSSSTGRRTATSIVVPSPHDGTSESRRSSTPTDGSGAPDVDTTTIDRRPVDLVRSAGRLTGAEIVVRGQPTRAPRLANDLDLVRPDGTELHRADRPPRPRRSCRRRWSPDPAVQRLLYTRHGNHDRHVRRCDDRDDHEPVADAFWPTWSPDGDRHRLRGRPRSFGRPTRLTGPRGHGDASRPVVVRPADARSTRSSRTGRSAARLTWSPDGTRLDRSGHHRLLGPVGPRRRHGPPIVIPLETERRRLTAMAWQRSAPDGLAASPTCRHRPSDGAAGSVRAPAVASPRARRYNRAMAHRVTLIPGDGIGPELAEATTRVLDATGHRVRMGVRRRRRGGDRRRTGRRSRTRSSSRSGATRSRSRARSRRRSATGSGASTSTLRQALGLYANLRPARSMEGVETALRGRRPRHRPREHRGPVRRHRAHGRPRRRREHQDHHPGGVGADRPVRLRLRGRQRPAQGHGRPQGQHHEAVGRAVPRELPDRRGATTTAGSSSRTGSSTTCACSSSRSPSCTTCSCCRTCTATSSATSAPGLVGGLGVAPGRQHRARRPRSSSRSTARRPSTPGSNKANPTAMILSGALMLRHLGYPDAAERASRRPSATSSPRARRTTYDLGGTAGTSQFADAIIERLAQVGTAG